MYYAGTLVMLVAARRVWNVVLFSSGRRVFYLYCSLPLDQFEMSCCFPRGGKSSVWIVCRRSTSLERRVVVCLSSLNWTSCLTSRCSTNLERRAVFSRESILLFVLFIVARRIWNVVPFSSGRKLTFVSLWPLDLTSHNFPPFDELERRAVFLKKERIWLRIVA